jgi:O-antigen/teichoic acid export membrane protein
MLTRKAILNFLAAVVDQVARIGVQLVVIPIILLGLGESMFGYWQILARSVQQLLPLDGRSPEALKWKIANLQLDDAVEERQFQVTCALIIWLLHLPLLILACWLFFNYMPSLSDVSLQDLEMAKFAGWILIFNIVILGLTSLLEAAFRGMNIGYKRVGILALSIVVGGVLTVYAVETGGDIRAVAMAQVAASFFYLVIFFSVVKKYLPWLKLRRPSSGQVKDFYSVSIWFMLWEVFSKGIFLGEIIILGLFASSELVASYAITAFAASTVSVVVVTAIAATLPGFGSILEKKEYEKAAKLRKESAAYISFLIFSIGCLVLLLNESFVNVWVGGKQFAGPVENILIVITAMQLVFIRKDASFINLGINIKKKVLLGLVSLITCLAMGSIFIPEYGIVGLCVSMLIGRLPLSYSFPKISQSIVREKTSICDVNFFKLSLKLSVLVFCWFVGQQILFHAWIDLIFGGALISVVIFSIYLFLMPVENRQALVKRGSLFISKRAGR